MLASTFAQGAVREKRLRDRLCLALEHLAPVTVERERAGQVRDLHSGLAVMEAASEGRAIERGRDDRTFARELLLGRDAGYITWEESTVAGNVRRSRPILEANTWLQEFAISASQPRGATARGVASSSVVVAVTAARKAARYGAVGGAAIAHVWRRR